MLDYINLQLSYTIFDSLLLIVLKATGSYRTYSIPSKTAALVPEFAVEDLPSEKLQPRFLRLQ